MTALPNDPVTDIAPAAGLNRDLPATEFPSVVRIQPTDLVGPSAANRQHAALEKRTESLRVALNKVIALVNALDDTFLRKDGSPSRSGVVGPTTHLSMEGHRLTNVAAPVEDGDAARLADINYVLSLLASLSGTPVGMISGFAVVPEGWLVCDGASYEPTRIVRTGGVVESYPAGLSWAALGNLRSRMSNAGNPWGGDAVASMTLPDYRGRVILGAGTGVGLTPRALGAIGGAELHQLTQLEMPVHHHASVTWSGNSRRERDGGHGVEAAGITGDAGGGQAHNNMQPFATAIVCIKY